MENTQTPEQVFTHVKATFFDRFGNFVRQIELKSDRVPDSFGIRKEIEEEAGDLPTADGYSYIYTATSLNYPDKFTFKLVR